MGVGAGVGLDVPQAVLVVLPEDKTLLFGSANSLTKIVGFYSRSTNY